MSRMKFIIDPQIYNDQKFGGISRTFTEIYVALRGRSDVQMELPIVYSENLHLKEYGLFRNFKNFLTQFRFFSPEKKLRLSKQYKDQNLEKTKRLLAGQDFDVFIPTYYSPYFLEDLGDKPFVLAVYDMIHELFPHYFWFDSTTVPNKKLLIEKSTRIIANSENTKKDILKIYPHIDGGKIDVVYLSQSIDPKRKVRLDLPKSYFLFVGNRYIYKNFIFFIKSVAPLLNQNPDLFVVCAGGEPFDWDEIALLQELGVLDQVKHKSFEDDELATYYSKAKCFVFPSEYEGFGIPVLEAMVCGCPVVLAHHSSFPEVAGEAGVYFELNNETDLKNKVNELLQDETLRQQYIAKGLEQVKRFSWKKNALESLEIYKSVASKNTPE